MLSLVRRFTSKFMKSATAKMFDSLYTLTYLVSLRAIDLRVS